MSDVKWMIEAREFSNCNCAYGCPCQFNALPTRLHTPPDSLPIA